MNGAGSENLRTFISLWEDSIARTVEKVAGKKLAIQPSTEEAKSGIHPGELRISLGLQGVEQAEIEVALDAASTKMLGQCLLGEDPEKPAADNPEHAEAAIELVKQIVGQVSTAAKKLVGGRELRSTESKSSDWKPEEIVSLNLALAAGSSTTGQMALLFSPAFLQCLMPTRSDATNVSTIPVGPPVFENNLELLMETHLAVTLRFGQRQMLLREIMQLNSGSVVELDRKAADPVDLLLDDRIVARGQVVVVDGNYGLRITEICAT